MCCTWLCGDKPAFDSEQLRSGSEANARKLWPKKAPNMTPQNLP
jgi:hypothetical protein